MSNLSVNNLSLEFVNKEQETKECVGEEPQTIIYDKIIISDDSNDSDNSEDSDDSLGKKKIKPHSLMNKINSLTKSNNTKNKKIIIDKTKNNRNYKNAKIKNETKEILEKSYYDYHNANSDYYLEVLELLNNIFSDDSKSIMKLKLKKITLNEDIFDQYNSIVQKYKLRKDLFNKENFDISGVHDFNEIVLITKKITNNLLQKLGFKLDVKKYGKTKKLKINNILI
jgi:hypothetical protein